MPETPIVTFDDLHIRITLPSWLTPEQRVRITAMIRAWAEQEGVREVTEID